MVRPKATPKTPCRTSSRLNSSSKTPNKSSKTPNKSSNSTNRRFTKRPTKNVNIGTKCFKVTASILKAIKILRSTTHNCILKAPFTRLVKEVLQDLSSNSRSPLKMQSLALSCLQEASEAYIVQLFEDSNSAAAHARRITLQPKDIHFVLRLRGPWM